MFHFNSLLSPLVQLVACPASRRVLPACKHGDPAPARPVCPCRASPPHQFLLQDFRMELEASFKFPWPCCVPTAAFSKHKPCGWGNILQQCSMTLLEEESINIIANKRGLPPSSHHPWAAELSTRLDGCRALAMLLGRERETAARPASSHFALSRLLAIFSQLFYATDVTRGWVYKLKIKRALLKLRLLFCRLVNFLSKLPCSQIRDTSSCPAAA